MKCSRNVAVYANAFLALFPLFLKNRMFFWAILIVFVSFTFEWNKIALVVFCYRGIASNENGHGISFFFY